MTGGRAESSSRKTAGPAPTFARLLRRAVYRSAASTTTLTPKQRSWAQPWQACGTDNSMPQCAQSGMGFPDGWGFGKCVPEFAFGMGCGFPLDRKWKACPGIWLWNGMGFPVEGLGGKCVPESGRRMGCSFPLRGFAESASRNSRSGWDAVSRWGLKWKARPAMGSVIRFAPSPRGSFSLLILQLGLIWYRLEK